MITYAAPQPSAFTLAVLYPSLVGGFLLIMAALGFGFRLVIKHLVNLGTTLKEHSEKIAIYEARYPVNIRRLEDAEDVIEEMRTKQAVDHSTLHDHLRWHERQQRST